VENTEMKDAALITIQKLAQAGICHEDLSWHHWNFTMLRERNCKLYSLIYFAPDKEEILENHQIVFFIEITKNNFKKRII
jgi:hypothetical protein